MARFAHILVLCFVPACAGTKQSGSSPSPAVAPAGRTEASASSSEEEVPEWLRKKPKGDPSSVAGSERIAEEQREFLREFERLVATVNLADGVDEPEARVLGGAFFSMEFGVCGATEPPTDGGSEWLIRPRVGVTGAPPPEFIRVDKHTGKIRYGSGASVDASTAIEYERHFLQENIERHTARRSTQ